MARFDDQYSRGAGSGSSPNHGSGSSTNQWSDRSSYQSMAIGLGWFSIGLGLAEVAAPGAVAQLIGVRNSNNSRRTLQSFGMREIANGLALLQSRHNATWLWTRVGGDALGAAALFRALDDPNNDRDRVLSALGAVAGVAALDAFCAAGLSQRSDQYQYSRPAHRQAQAHESPHGIRVRKSFTINRQPDVVYAFWRDLENLPTFMAHLEEVRATGDRTRHWRAGARSARTSSGTRRSSTRRPARRSRGGRLGTPTCRTPARSGSCPPRTV